MQLREDLIVLGVSQRTTLEGVQRVADTCVPILRRVVRRSCSMYCAP